MIKEILVNAVAFHSTYRNLIDSSCFFLFFVFFQYSFIFFGMAVLGLSEKAMAPHSSTLAWKIPWTEDPGRL